MHPHLVLRRGHRMIGNDFSGTMGGSPVTFHPHVEDADAAWAKAVSAGAEVTMLLADQFWGDHYGQLRDPFGHKWSIGQTRSAPTPAELEEGAKAAFVA